mmetsp:Transcript_29556/g.43589  ORF Transcript_29556/g.43589 Transcript_29556/m.43589 type:complete len:94 (+) Transcript_29556:335-616(+)
MRRKDKSSVLLQYGFVSVVERLQESPRVVIQLLLGLETTDIFYLSSKVNDGYAYSAGPSVGCQKLEDFLNKECSMPKAMRTFCSTEQPVEVYT